MALRLLSYMVWIWERFSDKNKESPLPLIVPAVLAQVPGGWKAPTQFFSWSGWGGVGVEEGAEGGLLEFGLAHDVAVGEVGGRLVGVVHLAADDADAVAAVEEEVGVAGLVRLEDADDAGA